VFTGDIKGYKTNCTMKITDVKLFIYLSTVTMFLFPLLQKGRQPSYYFMNKSDILRLKEDEEAMNI
jgi:hypothetical protein